MSKDKHDRDVDYYNRASRPEEESVGHDRSEAYCPRCGVYYDVISDRSHQGH